MNETVNPSGHVP